MRAKIFFGLIFGLLASCWVASGQTIIGRPMPPLISSSFAPTNFPGIDCRLWLDSTDISTLFQDSAMTTPVTANGDALGGWKDKSGHAFDVTQTTSGNKPTYTTNAANSLAAIRFDGTNDVVVFANNDVQASVGSAEIFIVLKLDLDPPVVESKTGLWFWGNNILDAHFPFTDGVIYETWGTSARKTIGNPGTTLAQFNSYSVLSTNGTYTARLNETQIFTGANTAEFPIFSTYTIGKSFTGYYLSGFIAEVMIFSPPLNSTDRSTVDNYLQTKYALP